MCCWSTTRSCAARPAARSCRWRASRARARCSSPRPRREVGPMARESGARKVFFASAAPPVRFPNVYGIDMPTRAELIAAHRSEEEVAREIGADALIYQDLDQLKDAVRRANPKLASFETSCFDGVYVTGDITTDYLRAIEIRRDESRDSAEDDSAQMDLN